MALGGFTSFAKNALLTAQKHIDSALHLEEEDEAEEEASEEQKTQHDEQATERVVDDNESMYKSAIEESEQLANSMEASGSELRRTPSGHHHDQPETGAGFLDVDLNGPSPPPSQWGGESNVLMHSVVDTEPNPIRDTHETDHMFHYSPSSHSPDDEESSQNGQSSSTAAPASSTMDLSLLVSLDKAKELDDPDRRSIKRDASERTLDRFEDVGTVASSDIEVIRPMDDWSVTSSQTPSNNGASQHNQPHKSTNSLMPTISSLKELEQTHSELITKLDVAQSEQEMREQIELLKAKLKHRDQRIEELGRLNENLKATNANLAAKNKQKTTAESKLQTQFTEKEKQLNDLLEEGKKLSEYSGRQAKEIRKLKQQVGQLDTVTAARDSAVEELREAHQQLQEQENLVDQLKDDLEKSDEKVEELQAELDTVKEHSGKLEKQMCEHLTQIEASNSELKRLEKALNGANKERDELTQENRKLSAKLMNKKAHERIVDERDKGIEEDLRSEKAKNVAANARIRELEQRIESIQDEQRDIAVEISNANSPLLNNIAMLEEKVFGLERDNEALSRSLRQTTEQLSAQKRKHDIEVETMGRTLEEERQNNAHKTEELANSLTERTNLQSHLAKLEEELAHTQKGHGKRVMRMEQRIEELEADIKAKRSELTEMQRKNGELQQRILATTMEKRNNPPLVPLVTSASRLQQFNEGEDNLAERGRGEAHQLQWHLKQQKAAFAPPQRLATNNGGSPTPSQVRVDMNLPGEHSPNYLLDLTGGDHLRAELDSAHAQLFQLHERFESLLEMYGGCLETIEELKYDNEDLRKLCKEQALRLAELQHHSVISSPSPSSRAEEEE